MSDSVIMINQRTIREAMNYGFASELVRQGFVASAKGKIDSPSRHVYRGPEATPAIGFMPAVGEKYMSVKVAAVQYANSQVGLDSHQGAVLLFAKQTGALLSVIDASELTAIRTTAVSQVALQVLGDDRIKKVGIIGAGVQAFHHIRMLYQQFDVMQFVVVSHSENRVAELRDALRVLPIKIEHRDYGSDLKDCLLVICATHGEEIVLNRNQIARNTLVFAIGACHGGACELGDGLLEDSDYVVDSFTSLAGSGESIFRAKYPYLGEITELGQHIERPQHPKRQRPFIFKAVGLGFEDLVCAVGLYERALTANLGTKFNQFGGARGY